VIIAQILLDKFCKKTFRFKKVMVDIISVCGLFVFCAFGIGGYAVQVNAFSNVDKDMWTDLTFKNYSMQQFGTYGFYVKDLANMVVPPSPNVTKEDAERLLASGETELNTDAIFNGDNLIIVMLESFDWFAIDPYNTPTLYNLLGDSVVFSDFISYNKTNISEDIGLLGYMPFDEQFNVSSGDGLATKYSLPNLFKAQGYQTNYIHSYVSNFYNRNVINKRIGFDNMYFLDDAEIENKSSSFDMWNSEVDIFNFYKEQIAPTDGSKFMSFYLTVGTHGSYQTEVFSKYYDQYEDTVANTDYVEWMEEQGFVFPEEENMYKILREFKCAAIDTDKMISQLLEHLYTPLADDSRLIDNTNLVFYADHSAYYHELCFKMKGTDSKNYSQVKSFNVPLFIYSEKLEAQKVETFTHTYDIFPTICQLYGLPYNTYMALGAPLLDSDGSVYDDVYRIYYSQMLGYYTEKFYSSSVVNPVALVEDVTKEEYLEYNEKVWDYYNRQKVLNWIYKFNW
ncbi:MAG: LTA synthase family protein, partial [Clostridia bacterium]|nr:LTA synthase family protein [Clostridia bacterium]